MSFSFGAPQSPPAPSASPQIQDDNLTRAFSSLFTSGKYSDLLIKCQGQTWKAHRAVVCVQSRPLAAAIDGNFREAATGEIDLEDDDPEIVKFMLEFLYTGKISVDAPKLNTSSETHSSPFRPSSTVYSNDHQSIFGVQSNAQANNAAYSAQQSLRTSSGFPFGIPVSNNPSADTTAQSSSPITADVAGLAKGLVTTSGVYIIAEKYDIQPLKLLARKKYEALLPTAWNSKFFINSLKLIYDGTPDTEPPDGLRILAIRTAAFHARELMDQGEFLSLCRERGDITTDILTASLDGGSTQKRCKANPSHMLHLVSSFQSGFGNTGPRYRCAICGAFSD